MAGDLALAIATSALRAMQLRMDVAAHNIANADTPGYSRQVADLVASPPGFAAAGTSRGGTGRWMGLGVRVEAIRRIRDAYLDVEIREASELQSHQTLLSEVHSSLDRILGEPGAAGLSARLAGFFGAFTNAANDAASLAAREVLLTEASALADRFNGIAGQLGQERLRLNEGLGVRITELNGLADDLAMLNGRIAFATASGGAPNDLLDERDRILDRASDVAGATYSVAADGTASLSVGGKPLVSGERAFHLVRVLPGGGSPYHEIRYEPDNSLASVTGGEIGALLEGRDTIIPVTLAELDAVATALITEVNTLHSRGFGRTDQPTLTFTPGAPSGLAGAALGSSPVLRAGTWDISTTAGGAISAVFTPLGGAAEPAVSGTIAAGGTNDTLIPGITLTAPGALIDGSATIDVAGPDRDLFSGTDAGTISVAINDGRDLALAASSNASADGTQGRAVAGLGRALTMNGGLDTFASAWQGHVTLIGARAAADVRGRDIATAVADQLRARQASLSSVSLDEEGIEVIRAQRAYQAAAEIISAQDRMLAALLGAVS